MNVINWEQLKYILLIHSDPFCYQRESIIYKNSFVVSEKMQFLNVQNRQKELGSNTFSPTLITCIGFVSLKKQERSLYNT